MKQTPGSGDDLQFIKSGTLFVWLYRSFVSIPALGRMLEELLEQVVSNNIKKESAISALTEAAVSSLTS